VSNHIPTAGKTRRQKLDAAEANARCVSEDSKFSRSTIYRIGMQKGWELCEERLGEVLVELLNQEYESE
jgi:hypothetical protein